MSALQDNETTWSDLGTLERGADPAPAATAPSGADLLEAAEALCGCRFLPGSRARLFVRDMRRVLRDGFPLSDRQVAYLLDLRRKYRRQIDGTRKARVR